MKVIRVRDYAVYGKSILQAAAEVGSIINNAKEPIYLDLTGSNNITTGLIARLALGIDNIEKLQDILFADEFHKQIFEMARKGKHESPIRQVQGL